VLPTRRSQEALPDILGGIAIQTLVLVALDGFGVPRRPLTNATASLVQVLEGTLVIAVLAVAIRAILLPKGVVVGRIDPSALLIVLLWIGGLYLVWRASKRLPWKATGGAWAGRRRPTSGESAQAAIDRGDLRHLCRRGAGDSCRRSSSRGERQRHRYADPLERRGLRRDCASGRDRTP
jgi:hypothetical protein